MSAGKRTLPLATAHTIALTGIEGALVTVEAAVSNQLPGMAIIGLADTALIEAKQRVKLACAQSGYELSKRFLTVNLAPAALPKHGAVYDLAIALCALAASGAIPNPALRNCLYLGELGLDGTVKHTPGLLAAVLAAKTHGFTKVMVAAQAQEEASLVTGITVIPVTNLAQAASWVARMTRTTQLVESAVQQNQSQRAPDLNPKFPDIAEIIGQEAAKRALLVAAAGKHNALMIGPPGAGKTMLAHALIGILPPLTAAESQVSSSIAAIGGKQLTNLVTTPPFIAPHHTASAASIIGAVGGGAAIKIGDITRAHNGVLFLDETPEFSPKLLDALRQPLESGEIIIQRAKNTATLPARFQLLLAANPCPCGNMAPPMFAHADNCSCAPAVQRRYLSRISGPLSDRLDIRIWLHRITRIIPAGASDLTSAVMRKQVIEARRRQSTRFKDCPWSYNSQAPGSWLRAAEQLPAAKDTAVIEQALNQGALTMRGFDRILRLAWSIADLQQKPRPERSDIAAALALRGEQYA